MDLEKTDLKNLNFDNMTLDQRLEVEKIIAELEKRKLEYPILDLKLQDHQEEFRMKVAERKEDGTPRWKFIIFLWGNGSWKTFTWAYILISIALWKKLCEEFWIPFSGEASLIKVYTTTGDNIRDNIDRKYLLWTWTWKDILKFPWYVNKDKKWPIIKSVRHDKEILKEIKLNNWAVITFGTYDQGQARLQGWEPQYTWMDELPTRFEDLREIFRGSRNANWQIFISATPTNYNKKIHDYLFNWKLKDVLFVKQVDSFENEHADHSWMNGLDENDMKVVRFWSFTPPEGLVFPYFSRQDNVVEYVHPKKLWSRVKFYWAVDFWFKHPMAFALIAVDEDWHAYVFDMFHKAGVLMWELADWITEKKKEYWIKLEYIVADSAGAQERGELKAKGYPTRWVNKKAKVSKMSFGKGSRFKMNEWFNEGSLIISDKCEQVIDELEVHHFKDSWEVHKEDDDGIDAIRYFIWDYIMRSEKKETEKWLRRRAKNAQKKRKY